MVLSQRLDLRQSQSLVMTPQLQQAIKLLQFSNAELTEFVESELEKNPLLEADEGERSFSEEASEDNVTAYEKAHDPNVKQTERRKALQMKWSKILCFRLHQKIYHR